LETERRLTTLELGQESLDETVEGHASKHNAQDIWNKAFTIALAGLGSGLAHAKAGEVLEAIISLFRAFK
jgi:hypothetical protein